MSRPVGICPKCLEIKHLTKHHCFPKRFFPKQPKPVCLWICRDCHSDLEREIPYRKKMSRDFYLKVVRDFLKRGTQQEPQYI